MYMHKVSQSCASSSYTSVKYVTVYFEGAELMTVILTVLLHFSYIRMYGAYHSPHLVCTYWQIFDHVGTFTAFQTCSYCSQ